MVEFLRAKKRRANSAITLKARSNANCLLALRLRRIGDGTGPNAGGASEVELEIPPDAKTYGFTLIVVKIDALAGGAPPVTLAISQGDDFLDLNDDIPGPDPNPYPINLVEFEDDVGYYEADLEYLVIDPQS